MISLSPSTGLIAAPLAEQLASLLPHIFDQLPLGLVVLDRDLRLVRYNQTWATYCDRYSPSRRHLLAVGAGYFDLVDFGEVSVRPALERVLAGETIQAHKLFIQTETGPSYWNVVFAPLPNDHGVAGILAVGADITEQVLAERERERALDELRRSHDEIERHVANRTRELTTLVTVQQALTSSLKAEEVLQIIADEARLLTDARIATVFLPEGDELVLKVVASDAPTGLMLGYRLPMDASVAGRVYRSGEALTVNDAMNDARVHDAAKTLVNVRTLVSVPMRVGGRTVGVMSVADKTSGELGPEDERLLSMMAPAAAIALENARLYEQASEAAAAAERGRLARDLHDAVTQILFSASLTAEVLPRIWEANPAEGMKRLEKLRELTRGALAEMRTLLLELRPSALLETSLADLLQQLAQAINGRSRIPIEIHLSSERPLPPDVQIAFYRIAQEALNNVARHSGAQRVQMDLRCTLEGVDLRIADDGCGFDTATRAANHLGLGIMRERADQIGAALHIQSRIGIGTEVVVRWRE